jgi:hypothetical protein
MNKEKIHTHNSSYTQNGVLLGLKKGNPVSGDNIHEPILWYIKWNKPGIQ